MRQNAKGIVAAGLVCLLTVILVAVQLRPWAQDTTEPFKSELITQWGRAVTAENAWREYPRPQMERGNWVNLNGYWDYAITGKEDTAVPTAWAGKILVPFSLESRLGGVQRLLQPKEALWYRRSVTLGDTAGKRVLLNFEAVDYRCRVWVNGTEAGAHQGGNTPFSLDVTGSVRAGENEILVRVEDETEGWQLRGKQVLKPEGIWYTRVSGIWQTVWMEEVPMTYIEDVHLATDAEAGTIGVSVDVEGATDGLKLKVAVKDGDALVAAGEGALVGLVVQVPDAKLWSPASPHLYGLDIVLLNSEGTELDRVASYAGIRSVGRVQDEAGHWRFALNGKPIFHWGTLDQGWWPDGLLTPPSDEAMLYDIEYLKAAGFNMIRKHIKVEPRRYYYHCDRLGMMLWQDQPSAGHGPKWRFLAENPEDAAWPEEHHAQFMRELEAMIDTLENHPCIQVWVAFNEAWGQHRSIEVGRWLKERDGSRLVNIASGGNFFPVGDVADHHSYPHPTFPKNRERFADYIKVVGEFGGHGFLVQGHLWNPSEGNWAYGNPPKTREELVDRIRTSLDRLKALRAEGIAAGVYTQTTDLEIEVTGLLTYDRAVAKIPAEEFAALSKELLSE